jgi:hypothetical protein
MQGDHVPRLEQSGDTCPHVTQGSLIWTFKNHCHLMHIKVLRHFVPWIHGALHCNWPAYKRLKT